MKKIIIMTAVGILLGSSSFALFAEEPANNNPTEVPRPARRRPEGGRKGRMNGEHPPWKRIAYDQKRAEELWKQLAAAKTDAEKKEIQQKYDIETVQRVMNFRRGEKNGPGMRGRNEGGFKGRHGGRRDGGSPDRREKKPESNSEEKDE